jgi:phosphatidylethanolamine-binding protein (PEBP) family uncharacterized protein
MHSTKFFKLTISGVGLAAMLFGCSSTSDNTGTGGSGTGGTTSSTGGHATGGTGTGGTGTGGLPATGGTPGTGGIVSTGGTPGTGGIVSTGGVGGGGGGHGGSTTGGGGHAGSGSGTGGASSGGGSSGSMTLTSPSLADGAHITSKYTCQETPALQGKTVGNIGNGINPELDWTNPPAGTMSFAMTFLDTTLIDMGGTQVMLGEHWAIWNIPLTATSLMEGLGSSLTGSLMGAKQSGTFLAPCAGSMNGTMGDKYEFTLYALSTSTLSGLSGTSVDAVRKALAALPASQILGPAVLTGYAGKAGM